MKHLNKLLLPFIPDNEVLSKKLLHRLVKVVTIVWSLIIVFGILYIASNAGYNTFNYLNTPAGAIAKITDSSTGLRKTITYEQLGQIVKQKYPDLFNDETDFELGTAVYNNKIDPVKHDLANTTVKEASAQGKTKEEAVVILEKALIDYNAKTSKGFIPDQGAYLPELLKSDFINITSIRVSKYEWKDNLSGSLIPLPFLLVLYFLPALFYRTILYIVMGSWNGGKK